MNKYSADELFKIAYSHLQKKEFEKSTQLFEKLLKDYPDNLSILKKLKSLLMLFLELLKKQRNVLKKLLKLNLMNHLLINF